MPMTPVVVIFTDSPREPRQIAQRVSNSLRRAGYQDLSTACRTECDACPLEEIAIICARYVQLYGLANHKGS